MFFLSPSKISNKQLQDVFYEKSVLKIFTKLTEKHLCQNLFLNKVVG